jgi:hypothetical protein
MKKEKKNAPRKTNKIGAGSSRRQPFKERLATG